MTTRGRRLVVVASATAVALLSVEATLTLLSPQSLGSSWLTTSPRGYALNRPSTTVTHVMPGRSVRYRINSLGFRGEEPAGGGRRVLVVGDSVTFGWGLEEPDTYVARIAASAAAEFGAGTHSFMNAAVAGWGSADYVAFIEDEGDRLQPDVVLVFAGFDAVRRSWESPLWSMAADGTVSRRPPDEVRPGVRGVAEWPGYRFLIEHSHTAQLVRQAVLESLPGSTPHLDQAHVAEALALTEQLFARLAAWCRSRGVALLVSTGNLLEFAEDAESMRNPTAAFFRNAEALFARLGVPYLSVARAHGPLPVPLESLEIPQDDHPNERGAGLIFDAVWPWLRTQLATIAGESS